MLSRNNKNKNDGTYANTTRAFQKTASDVHTGALEAHLETVRKFGDEIQTPPPAGALNLRASKSPTHSQRTLAVLPAKGTPRHLDFGQLQDYLVGEDVTSPAELIPGTNGEWALTEDGEELHKSIDFSVFAVYSSSPTHKKRSSDFNPYTESSAEAVSPPRTAKKQRNIRTTPAFQALVAELKRLNKSKRDQQKEMSRTSRRVKATAIASEAGIAFEAERFEWLHLISHEILDQLGQDKENLVVGTKGANTIMIPVESYLPLLSESFGSNFSLSVIATLLEGTHIAERIDYRIEIDQPLDLEPLVLEFSFDALHASKPSRRIKSIVHAYMQCFFDSSIQQLEDELAERQHSARRSSAFASRGACRSLFHTPGMPTPYVAKQEASSVPKSIAGLRA